MIACDSLIGPDSVRRNGTLPNGDAASEAGSASGSPNRSSSNGMPNSSRASLTLL